MLKGRFRIERIKDIKYNSKLIYKSIDLYWFISIGKNANDNMLVEKFL